MHWWDLSVLTTTTTNLDAFDSATRPLIFVNDLGKSFFFLSSDAFSPNFYVCFDERHIFRATTSAKIEKQNKEIIIFGQKTARLCEVIYLQPGLGGWPLLFENYSKISS